MGKISILDCTLRDGGYINQWHFGRDTVINLLNSLSEAEIDIIECGFLSDVSYNEDATLFNSVEAFGSLFTNKKPGTLYVAMIALGEEEIACERIAPNNGDALDGIRITFHEHEIDKAMEMAADLMGKGYRVFMQPVGTTSYTDEKLIGLINKINALNPYAFYLVDTLGVMYKNDLLRLFYLVDNNLNKNIQIGYHSHNNLQLAFSNAQELMMIHTKRQSSSILPYLGWGGERVICVRS